MNSPKPLLVANLKAHQTWDALSNWIDELAKPAQDFPGTIIFCPSYPFLASSYQKISQNGINLKMGSQDISRFEQGAYTGEVSASQIADLVQFAIIGHSERRKYFSEGDDDIIKKVENLINVQITPILCISDLNQLDTYIQKSKTITENSDKIIFVYEPPSAISGDGDYKPESVEDANLNAGKIGQKLNREVITIYGGSLNADNISAFFSQKNIQGGLVGQASVDPATFAKLVKNAKI